MRRRTLRTGLRLLLLSLVLIILASFSHGGLLGPFLSSPLSGLHLYGLLLATAAAMGASGVILAVAGLVLPSRGSHDAGIRIVPLLILLLCAVALFFYLLVATLSNPAGDEPLRPGTSISI